jgi:hypothetical protein
MMFRRNSNIYFLFLSGLLVLLCLMVAHAVQGRAAALPSLHEKRELVKSLELTDLCLFTEARYTRHLAVADVHSAFQDGPLSFEHFPSGSFFLPLRSVNHD